VGWGGARPELSSSEGVSFANVTYWNAQRNVTQNRQKGTTGVTLAFVLGLDSCYPVPRQRQKALELHWVLV